MPIRHDLYTEPDLFLWFAALRMKEYHERTGWYADEWFLLDYGWRWRKATKLQVDRPTPRDGPIWRPAECNYTYLIMEATRQSFVVLAVDNDGDGAMKLTEGMREGVRLKELLCYREGWASEPLEKQARMFINHAAILQIEHNREHGKPAPTWHELGMHWAFAKHTLFDRRVASQGNGCGVAAPRSALRLHDQAHRQGRFRAAIHQHAGVEGRCQGQRVRPVTSADRQLVARSAGTGVGASSCRRAMARVSPSAAVCVPPAFTSDTTPDDRSTTS